MHLPGYIQEGQETIFGYLLLGVYYRNSPGCTTSYCCFYLLQDPAFRETLMALAGPGGVEYEVSKRLKFT
jgi:hypothetical protein